MFLILIVALLFKQTLGQTTGAVGDKCMYTFYVPKSTGNQCEGAAGSDGAVQELTTLYIELQKQNIELQKQMTVLQNQNTEQQRQINQLQSTSTCGTQQGENPKDIPSTVLSAAYIRWGRNVCPVNSSVIYKGYASGSKHSATGGISEYLCLPSHPQWGRYVDGHQYPSAIYGVEYQTNDAESVFSQVNNDGNHLVQHDVPCVYCEVNGRGFTTTFPAHTECPVGWHLEYKGYLMGPRSAAGDHHYADPVCMDESPEVVPSGGRSNDESMFWFVQPVCGSLPCPPYVDGREIACVVCSK